MEESQQLIVFLVLCLCLFPRSGILSEAKLAVLKEKECGELQCQAHEYCANIDHTCRPCRETCDSSHNNFDRARCEDDCQDYIHDLRFLRHSSDNTSTLDAEILRLDLANGSLESDLRTMKILIGVTLVVTTLVLFILIFILVYVRKSRNRLGTAKSSNIDLPIIYNNKYNSSGETVAVTPQPPASIKSENNNFSPPSVTRSESSSVSVEAQNKKNQRFRREPSESTLPEYAYDNPTLAPSPIHIV